MNAKLLFPRYPALKQNHQTVSRPFCLFVMGIRHCVVLNGTIEDASEDSE